MVRSLYSGVSGLTTHQTRMDVIGNNIANVNTHGFKASRTTFRDVYYQTSIGATAGRQTFGGNNAAQVGYGVQLGSIDKDMSQSNGQQTGKLFDLMISGDGMFMTASYSSLNLSSDTSASKVGFTRMGYFTLDSQSNVSSSNNILLVGSRNSLLGLSKTSDESGHLLDAVEFKDRNGDGVVSSSDVTFRNVINMNELIQTAFNVFSDRFGYLYGYDWDTILTEEEPGENGLSDSGLVVYDLLAYGGTADDLAGETLDVKKQYIDVQQTIMNLNEAANDAENDNHDVAVGYRYYCDLVGDRIKDDTGADIDYEGLYGALLEAYNNLATAGNTEEWDAAKQEAANAGAIIESLTYTDMTSVDIGKDGVISVSYNGKLKALARIELATFDNYDGLVEDGDTTFMDSAASGIAKIRKISDMPDTLLKSGYLEMSNVNLANEFSDMIVTQRGFQANARIITTSDSMLEELVNLKR